MKKLLAIVVSVCSVLPSAVHAQEAEESSWVQRHKEKFERYAIDAVPSVVEDCAFGARIESIAQGALSGILGKIQDAIDFTDENFFCGFGTDDIWRDATDGTIADGSYNVDDFIWQTRSDVQKEVVHYGRDIFDDNQRKRNFENVYYQIFKEGEADSEERSGWLN